MKLKQLLLGLALCASGYSFAQEARLLRFPAMYDNQIAFSYAGDIYTVDARGGVARKLTSHIGYEMMPRFSPDGSMLAFTGQMDGNSEVYVMPSEGGEPRRLTYTATLGRDDIGDRMGPNNIVMDWTYDGKNITYRSRNQTFNDFTGQLFNVPVSGGASKPVELKNSGFANWSPDGKQLAYNYIFREFRTWKRYKGGMADDIRIFDTNTKKSQRITDNPNQDIVPMWSKDGKKVYYISDRDNVMNLYEYDLASKQTQQLTQYKDYDIKFPSISATHVVYEYAGYIYKFDLKTREAEKVNIEINNDRLYAREKWYDLSKKTYSHSLSSDGKMLSMTARGDIFLVPAKEGVTLNYTNSCDANDKFSVFSPKGNELAYVSDKSGEFNIHILNLDTKKERQLTKIKGFVLDMQWSPDAKNIVWSEKRNTLNITNIETGKTTLVEKSGRSTLTDFDISPDSRWIVYSRPEKTVMSIVLYNIETAKKTIVTDLWYDSYSPRFSRDGKYLVFVSDRSFNPTYSRTEWNHAYTNMAKMYIIPLQKSTPSPFAYNPEGLGDGKISEKLMEIDLEGLNQRIIDIPTMAGNYYINAMINNKIYYSNRGSMCYDLKTQKAENIGARVTFSADYSKVILSQNGKYSVANIPSSKASIKNEIDLSGVTKLVDYPVEWAQIYDESWRQMRDYFYDKNMHGVDWDAVRTKYSVLVPYVAHRSDLAYIIGEMIGELNIGHAYSQNGEAPMAQRIKQGLLGAQFEKDKSGVFKITRILDGVAWDKKLYSPLRTIASNVKVGDFILAIDGISTSTTNDIYTLLVNKANRYVELTINSTPKSEGARKVVVKTIADEAALYYYSWVENNIKKVSEATDGKVGYIHIPDMGVEGLNEFMKHYYPQLNKQALIIDDRGNGGGNVSPMIAERLMRTPTFYTMHTNQTEGDINPTGTFIGPKILLANEYSASDGDLFPYRFKFNKIGKIVGRRTWGGVVGYSGAIPVVDGGSIVTPSYAPYAVDGSEFIIEGRGVSPDIDIENDPHQEFMGNDQQLNKAIEEILKELKEKEVKFTPIPNFPNKSGK